MKCANNYLSSPDHRGRAATSRIAPKRSTVEDIYVIIATSMGRTDLLTERSLLSVYRQVDIDGAKVKVIIVDDNEVSMDTISEIRIRVTLLRSALGIENANFRTEVIPNIRTKHHSGTGAWNTGIYHAFKESPMSFVAILDDDDTYLPGHLSDCWREVERYPETLAVFQELVWALPDESIWNFPLRMEDLTPQNFFIGNPGVQGSNMFIRSRVLASIGGFDETFKSTTDRELMIRLLRFIQENFKGHPSPVHVINSIGVTHYCHEGERVTTNRAVKHAGLNRFYDKFKASFSDEDYLRSLRRALILFDYQPFNHD